MERPSENRKDAPAETVKPKRDTSSSSSSSLSSETSTSVSFTTISKTAARENVIEPVVSHSSFSPEASTSVLFPSTAKAAARENVIKPLISPSSLSPEASTPVLFASTPKTTAKQPPIETETRSNSSSSIAGETTPKYVTSIPKANKIKNPIESAQRKLEFIVTPEKTSTSIIESTPKRFVNKEENRISDGNNPIESSRVYPVLKKEAATSTDMIESDSTTSSSSSSTISETFAANRANERLDYNEIRKDILEVSSSKSGSILEVTGAPIIIFNLDDKGILGSNCSLHLITKSFPAPKSLLKSRKSDNPNSNDTSSTNLEIGHAFVYMIIPPDGGCGWFICFISFLCQIVVDGIIFSVGVILPHIAKEFNISGSSVVLVASMQVGCYFLSGVVASAFINKYGFRPVAVTGSLLSITVLSISTFSVNPTMLIVFYSVLGGPALSMIWVSSQLIIGYYFDKFRPIANGASCSGAGIGIMSFSYMNNVLVPVMGWRNLMRLHVAFLVVVLLMTLTYIEVAPTRIGRVTDVFMSPEDTDSDSTDFITGLTRYSRYSFKVKDEEQRVANNFKQSLERSEENKGKTSSPGNQCLQKCCPCITRCLERRRQEKAKKYVIKQDPIDKQDFFYTGPNQYADTDDEQPGEIVYRRATVIASIDDQSARWRTISLENIQNHRKRKTIVHTLSTLKMSGYQEERGFRRTYAQLKLTEKRPFMAFLSPRNWLHPKIIKAFNLLFDFRLLAIMEFRILLLSAFLFPMGFNIPFVYSTVRVQIEPSFARLITPTIGFSNFVFRLASGFVAYKFRESTAYICGGGMFFGGLAVLVSAFYGLDVVWFQFLYAVCYGIAPAFYSTLRAIIYVHALGLDKLTNAFGLTALAMGLGVFIGTTAGGILNDLTGNYKASFIFAGICICTAGALKLLLPYSIELSKGRE